MIKIKSLISSWQLALRDCFLRGLILHSAILSPPPLLRRVSPLIGLGSLGVAALLIQPIPPKLLATSSELQALPVLLQHALIAINPLLLMITACLVGGLCAHRVGLRSWLSGTATGESPQVWVESIILGLLMGATVWLLDALWLRWLSDEWRTLTEQTSLSWQRLALGILYGGITEEILARWGLMSLLLWCLLRPSGLRPSRWGIVCAILISALVFGCAHLPALAAQVDLDMGLVARTLVLNGLGGTLYGWLFWRYHLESAMTAHAASHLVLFLGQLLANQ